MFSLLTSVVVLSASLGVSAQQYSATYLPSTAPDHTEEGQYGTNKCGGGSNQTSLCQNSYREWFFSNPGLGWTYERSAF
jgi:hypothetical protein